MGLMLANTGPGPWPIHHVAFIRHGRDTEKAKGTAPNIESSKALPTSFSMSPWPRPRPRHYSMGSGTCTHHRHHRVPLPNTEPPLPLKVEHTEYRETQKAEAKDWLQHPFPEYSQTKVWSSLNINSPAFLEPGILWAPVP